MSPRSASRDRREEALPFVREHLRDAELIVPVELGLGQRVDAAHDQFADALGMRLGIGERQRRAPGAAEHQPFVEAAHLAQPLDVGDEMPGRVGLQRGMRRRLAAAALVEQDDVVERRDRTAAAASARCRRPARHAGRRPAWRPWCRRAPNRSCGRRRHRACRSRTARSRDRSVRSSVMACSRLPSAAAILRCRGRDAGRRRGRPRNGASVMSAIVSSPGRLGISST